MACTQIPEPASTSPATSDWQKELAKVAYIGGEARKFILTNWDDGTEPQVAQGSRFEVNGAYYICSANESITGWSGITIGAGIVYIYATASAGSVTFSYSSTAPTYSAVLGGWYNGTVRCLFLTQKTDTSLWGYKRYCDDIYLYAGESQNAQYSYTSEVANLSLACDSYILHTGSLVNLGLSRTETATTQAFDIYKPVSGVWTISTDGNSNPVSSGTTQIQIDLKAYGWVTIYTASFTGDVDLHEYIYIQLNPGSYRIVRSITTGVESFARIINVYGQTVTEPTTIGREV